MDLTSGFRGAMGRAIAIVALAAATAACGSGLSSAEWAWCKTNLPAVDAAAGAIGLPQAPITYKEPSWWADYLTSVLNQSNSLITGNADFTTSCNAAADKRGVGASRVSWCLSDGVGDAWSSAEDLGLTVSFQADTYAYKGLPLSARIDNADFVKACRSAYSTRS